MYTLNFDKVVKEKEMLLRINMEKQVFKNEIIVLTWVTDSLCMKLEVLYNWNLEATD